MRDCSLWNSLRFAGVRLAVSSNVEVYVEYRIRIGRYTLSEAWSGVNWADLIAVQGAFGSDFYDRSTSTIVGTMLWTEYRPVIKIGPKGALGSHEIRPIHSAPSLGQSLGRLLFFSSNGRYTSLMI